MRALIIEDDAATAQTMELMLKAEGFNTYWADLGEEGVDLAKTYDYDIITLDLNLPDMNGLEVLRQIRAAKVKTPVMIVSGNSAIETKVKAFGAGADDYLTKPFHKEELIARIKAIVLRAKGHAQSTIVTGDIEVNLDAKTVIVAGRPVHLTVKEYQMMELLSLRKGTTLTKDHFLNHLYGGMDEPEIKIIDVFICKLRTKLRAAGAGNHIETIWGRGYRLLDAPSREHKRPTASREITAAQKVERVLGSAWPKGLSSREIADKVDNPTNTIIAVLSDLKRNRRVDRLGDKSSGYVYRLAQAPDVRPQSQVA